MAASIAPEQLQQAFRGARHGDGEARAAVFPLLVSADLWTCETNGLLNKGSVAYIDLPNGMRCVMAFTSEANAVAWAEGKARPVRRAFTDVCWLAVSRELQGGIFIDTDMEARFMVGFSEALYIVCGLMPGPLLPGMRNPAPYYPPGWHMKVGAPETHTHFQAEQAREVLPELPAVRAAYLVRVVLNEHLPYLVIVLEFRPDVDEPARNAAIQRIAAHVTSPRIHNIRQPLMVEAMTPELRDVVPKQVEAFYTAA